MPKRLLTLLAPLLLAIGLILAREIHQGGFTISPSPAVQRPVVAVTSTLAVATSTAAIVPATTSTNALIIRAVDGDTLIVKVDGEIAEQRVRMLGIDTPETVDPRKPVQCFGKEASKHMHELVDGKRVRLEADPQADERDKYNRLLRNVILPDGTDVNAAMVHDGYAHAYLSFPLNPSRKRELKNLEEDAKLTQRGLWSPTTCNGNTTSK